MIETPIAVRCHISLRAEDLQASIAFYRDLLGVEPDKVRADYARFTTDAPPLVLSLVAPRATRPLAGAQRVSHLGLRLLDEALLGEFQRRMDEAGRSMRSEPESRCCYARQRKLWLTDPDGNAWEIYTLTEDLEAEQADVAGCCD